MKKATVEGLSVLKLRISVGLMTDSRKSKGLLVWKRKVKRDKERYANVSKTQEACVWRIGPLLDTNAAVPAAPLI